MNFANFASLKHKENKKSLRIKTITQETPSQESPHPHK